MQLAPTLTERVLDLVDFSYQPPNESCWGDFPHDPTRDLASAQATDQLGLCPYHRRQILGHD